MLIDPVVKHYLKLCRHLFPKFSRF